ncbi:uncharacterized protein LOC132546017 isoform X2 [Ylistrum balloti]|nr:uncharacterized protein LOC132546017 isoform X2 [Ylistrum balloti]
MKEEVRKKVQDKEDLFLTIHKGAKPKSDTKKSADVKEPKPSESKVTKAEEPVSSKPERKPNSKADGLMQIAVQFISKGNFQQAVMTLEEITRIDPSNMEAHLGLVDIYLKAERPKKALKWCRKTRELYNSKELALREAQCYLNMKKSDKAIDLLLAYCKDMRKSGGGSQANKYDVQVMLARAYLQKDQKDMAITVLQGVLREDEKNVDALAEFAPLIFPYAQPSQKDNTMSVVLTLLSNNKDNSFIKEKFASMCKAEHGLEVLESVSGQAWKDVSAVVFMATSLRDCGAIQESLKLLHHAYRLEPSNAHTLLTYVHTMELVEQHTKAVTLIKEFVQKFPDQTAGCFSCGMVEPVIKGLTGDIYCNIPESNDPNLAHVDPIIGDYTEEQRYLLALMFTLVKILFVKGALGYIPSLTRLLDPCCEGHNLHETNIRNEYAYYTCIGKVLSQQEELPHLTPDTSYVYFVGDSHCVPPAWQKISYQGSPVTIHPILSTGTKIWHLREESVFYPKTNFESAVDSIPNNSTVMFCLGEIDCREALLYCVEQARYDSLEDAINAVIDIYLEKLLMLRKERNWDIHVHPVMPVLEPTRPVVMQFNKQLATRVHKNKRLHWLTFVEDLLIDGSLRPEYEFDGTHCHPSYVSLLEKALAENKVETSQT